MIIQMIIASFNILSLQKCTKEFTFNQLGSSYLADYNHLIHYLLETAMTQSTGSPVLVIKHHVQNFKSQQTEWNWKKDALF